MDTAAQNPMDHAAILRGVWRRHKILLFGIFLSIATPLLLVVFFTDRPLYVSKAMISIEPSVLEQLPFLREPPRGDTIATHMILLKSRSLSEAVAESLPRESLDELLTKSQYTDYLLLLKNTVKGWLGKAPTVLSPRERAIAELQKARMEFRVSTEAINVFIITASATKPRVAMDLANTYIQVLLSRTRDVGKVEARQTREFLEQQYQQAKENLTRAEDAIAEFQNRKGRVVLGGQTELDLVRLAQLENTLAETQANRQVLSSRIASLRQSLEQAKPTETKDPRENQQRTGNAAGGSLPVDTLTGLNAFRTAQEQLVRLETKLASMRERYTEANPLVQLAQEEVNKQRARVAQMARELPAAPSRREAGDSPINSASLAELSDTQAQLASFTRESSNLEAKEGALNLQLTRLRSGIRNLSQDEVQFGNMRRSLEASRSLLTALSDKLMATRVREQGEPSVIRIVDPASFPPLPTDSKIQKLALMVLLLAGGVAFGAVFGLEAWRQPVETETDVRKTTGLRVLGSVGKIVGPNHERARLRGRSHRLPMNLFTGQSSPNPLLELYRKIRATIETQRLESPFRSILVTSPGPNEGKSTTLLNLAHAFQEIGRRVLVVEADLRRPVLYRTLSLNNSPGLVDFLSGTATFDQVCHRSSSGLTIIPGQIARGNAASLLASPRVKELLDQAYSRFDLVLADTPPVLAVPDNLLLATVFDRIILVVKSSATSKRDLRSTLGALMEAKAGIGILGVVLNQADHRDVSYYQARYHKYYSLADGKASEEATRRSETLPGVVAERRGSHIPGAGA